ncbi:MAG TPA: sugar phosphate isomerase/epimerase family protein [Acidobacteriota bacterium]|nr:sugar phosphate isomerase/epimerase family protein [Acidobacteriota bacterium]
MSRNRPSVLPSRRDLLSAAGLAAAAIGTAQGSSWAPESGKGRYKNAQLSLAAYSRRQDLTAGKMDLFQFIDWCAELDLPGTELTSYFFKEGFDKQYLRELRRHAFSKGVTVSGTAIRNNFCLPPGPQKDKEIAHVKRWIDEAAELFAPHIRIFGGDLPRGATKEAGIQWVADGIKEVLPRAAERGIILGLENHGGITARAADLLAICDKVGNSPWFGINLDTGNFHTNAYEELAMVAPRAVNVQVKVEIVDNSGRNQPVDLQKIRDILEKANYKGWVALEYEAEEDPVKAIPFWIKKMKETFGGC